MWTAQSPQSFDPAAAGFLRLVPQMRFKRAPHGGPNVRPEPSEVYDGFGGEDDGEGHSG